ncbi:MAG: c-type cytochrome [Acidobacteriota bacterium]|nr:c-type cytochrome [Acidobacteriota bacterium]
MRRFTVFCALIAVFVVAGAAVSQVEIQKAPITWQQAALTDGKELYAELCAVCHGADAKGNGPAAAALKKPVPDVTQLTKGNQGVFPAEDVRKAITGEAGILSHGTLEMPIWGKVFADVRPDVKPFRREAFARQQIYNLTAYVESVQAE